MQGVILAAGRGKRLHPITLTRTKAMTPVVGKPIVLRVMEMFIANGINDFILVISPDDQEIRDYFLSDKGVNAKVRLVQQPEPLGMAHALSQAAPFIQDDFILSSCDNLVTPAEIKRMISVWRGASPHNAILTLIPVGDDDLSRMGIVKLEGEWVVNIIEKPGPEKAPSKIASVPLYLFSQQILDYIEEVRPSVRGEFELQDAIQMLIDRNGGVRGLTLYGRQDLTTPDDLLTINLHYLMNGASPSLHDQTHLQADVKLIQPVYIEPDVQIGANCTIGPNVYLERGCSIGSWVTLRNTIVLRERSVVNGETVIGKVIG